MKRNQPSPKPADSVDMETLEDWRTDWRNIDEQRRARIRRDAGGASRDLVGRV